MSTATSCPYCGVGCGVDVTVTESGAINVSGTGDHPANFGRLCSKGTALGETFGLNGRLLHPMIKGMATDWNHALDHVAAQFRAVIARHGPDAIAFYVSGQLLTEDYYVANKLIKGFIGTANIDTNSRLCMASSVAGHKRAFGEDIVPGNYADFDLADLAVLVGSNTAWCHPVLYQRLMQRREAGQVRIVNIDPRRTATSQAADLHLALRPGTDVHLFNGLLCYLEEAGAVDHAYVAGSTSGYAAALAQARQQSGAIRAVADACGLAGADVAKFFSWFSETRKTLTLYSQGVNQSTQGTDKVNAILNCHLATGRIGQPGMGPFSLTGQPNAMGGREVGGLANQLAAHMDFANPQDIDRVGRFWGARRMAQAPGLKAVDMFRAIGDGRIKAVWIMATNPAVSLPDANAVRAALDGCEFVVVSDCVAGTDTAKYADVLLPAAGWGEKDGTVTNSERRISRQRSFMPPPADAKPDWWIITEVAQRMGYGKAFGYTKPADIFREHAQLSGFENTGTRLFDVSALAALDDAAYDDLTPVQWPVTAACPGGAQRLLGDGKFPTPDGRARFIATASGIPAYWPVSDYPMVLNTGRTRDQWHTMTRTGPVPKLGRHSPEPYVEIGLADAARYGLTDGGLARVRTELGEAVLRVRINEDQRPGMMFAPMHWNDQFASSAIIGSLIPAATDPISGQPEFKCTPANIGDANFRWSGLLLSRQPFTLDRVGYWSRRAGAGCHIYQLAGYDDPSLAGQWVRDSFGAALGSGDIVYQDRGRGLYRAAHFGDEGIEACLFIGRGEGQADSDWLESLFDEKGLAQDVQAAVLYGRPAGRACDSGPVVCACYNVGQKTIINAILSQGLQTVASVGASLQAGTNCGSCRPEIQALLNAIPSRQDAA
ncbi:MAG: molybdopterin-dependent oxidoreductase [Alphaproteobacteria bacterium]